MSDYIGPERRKRGRPPLCPGRAVNMTVWLPEDQIDEACRLAILHGVSVSAVVRMALRKYFLTVKSQRNAS